MKRTRTVTFILTALAIGACGTAQTTDTTVAASTTADVATTATTEAVPEGLVTTMDDLPSATIQIVSTGSFVTPDFGEFEGGGSGSGFIVDPSGIAVTNSHVVSGAGLIEVFVGGDPKPINAQILGVSECNDLAVIDLAGDGYQLPRVVRWIDNSGHGRGRRGLSARRPPIHGDRRDRLEERFSGRDRVGLGGRNPGARRPHPARQLRRPSGQ